MAWDMVLLREPLAYPPSFCRSTTRVPGNLERGADSTQTPSSSCPDQQVNLLKEKGMTGVYVAAHWLARQVQPLKKQIHPGWEYCGPQDPTQETRENVTLELLVKHLGEIFQDTSCWTTDEQVRSYHIVVERESVRRPSYFKLLSFFEILYLVCLNLGFG
jgi:hypothetical protein